MNKDDTEQTKFDYTQQFNSNYCDQDFFQRRIHEQNVPRFVQAMHRKHLETKAPISILDFCCGYGIVSFRIVKQLLRLGVQIKKVVGYDISGDLIKKAIQDNPYPEYIKFEVKNLDLELSDVNEYDFAIDIFGLIWMNNTEKVIQDIQRSLKVGGVLFSVAAIDHPELSYFRDRFVKTEKWKNEFGEDYIIPKYHDSHQLYLQFFNKNFETSKTLFEKRHIWYTTQEFGIFLQSYLQQIRHLVRNEDNQVKKKAASKNFMEQFLNSIPKDYQGQHLLRKNNGIEFGCYIHYYDGIKIDESK